MSLAAQCRVYIAFSDGPLVASPTWTEVTQWVREVRTQRGRQNELDDFSAGTATVVLDNRGRRFDPDYTAGPYYGGLKVRRQVKIEAVHNAVTYPVFRGVVQAWSQQWPMKGRDATCTIQCADLFALLATWPLAVTAHEVAARSLSPTAFWGLDDDGAVAVDRVGGSNGVYGSLREQVDALESNGAGASRHAAPAGQATGSVLARAGLGDNLSSTDTTIAALVSVRGLVQDYNGFVAYDDALRVVALTGPANDALVLAVTMAGLPSVISIVSSTVQVSGVDPVVDGNTRHLCMVRSGANLALYVDGVSVATSASAGSGARSWPTVTIGNGPSGTSINSVQRSHDFTVDEPAVWHGVALTATQVGVLAGAVGGWVNDRADQRIGRVLDLLGVPSGLRTLAEASMSVGRFEGGTDALTYLQAVARSDRGRLFMSRAGAVTFTARTADMGASPVVTFADDSTANAVRFSGFELDLDDRLVANDVTVTGTVDTTANVTDATSIGEYSRRGLTLDTELPSLDACSDLARYATGRYAAPVSRGRAWTVHPERLLIGSASTRAWATVLARELGDLAAMRRTPPVGSTLTKTLQITSIAHEIDLPAGRWEVTFTGAPADTSPAFRWGVSTWGGSDQWS